MNDEKEGKPGLLGEGEGCALVHKGGPYPEAFQVD